MIFRATELTYRYNDQIALNRLSLDVRQGERLALLGANGSGKSTLLRLLDGLAFPESGELLFAGETLTEARLSEAAFTFQFRRRVGLVFQNPDAQLFNSTVFDELAFGPLQMGWPKERIREQVNRTLETMEIAHLRHRSPHRLSGGEKKRVAIASVMILDPEVLLLDEPTAALDPKSQHQIIEMIASFGGGAKTVITATHDLDSLVSYLRAGALLAMVRPSISFTTSIYCAERGWSRRTGTRTGRANRILTFTCTNQLSGPNLYVKFVKRFF